MRVRCTCSTMSGGFTCPSPGTSRVCQMELGKISRQGTKMKSAAVLAAFGFCFCAIAFAEATPPPPSAVDRFPSTITETECQGEQCIPQDEKKGTWVFHEYLGDAHWSDGAVAKLVIERFDESGVAMPRIDLGTSTSYGMTAVYTGTLKGNRIEGTVVWSWSGHWNDQHPSGKWSATVEGITLAPPPAQALPIPTSLTECEANQCAPIVRTRFPGPGSQRGDVKLQHGNQFARSLPLLEICDSADGKTGRRIDCQRGISYRLEWLCAEPYRVQHEQGRSHRAYASYGRSSRMQQHTGELDCPRGHGYADERLSLRR